MGKGQRGDGGQTDRGFLDTVASLASFSRKPVRQGWFIFILFVSLFFFLVEFFKHIKNELSLLFQRFLACGQGFCVCVLFFNLQCTHLGLFEAIPVLRLYLYPIRSFKNYCYI